MQTPESNGQLAAVLDVIEEINTLKDVDAVLDKILLATRQVTGADAGSIFLVRDGRLAFSYVHNDTLFGRGVTPHIYDSFTLPIDDRSVVGHAAASGKTLAIDDAYEIPEEAPYAFNRSFDIRSGYRTRSILAQPLRTYPDKTIGVLQLINATDGSGRIRPFTEDDRRYAALLANNASVAVERGVMTREIILRMMKMAEMRDPSETGPHVQRVGGYSAELYHKIMLDRGMDEKDIRRTKGLIRLAAMLHDIGKVGISDMILKKPGRLTPEEFACIKWHTVYGARLFDNATSELDELCAEIALGHHEKWDGTGYPGELPPDLSDQGRLGMRPLKGEEIPLSARITALADVFDALASRRSYKEAFPEEKVLRIIREGRGSHFDPEVVDAFFSIYSIIRAIQLKFRDAETQS